MGNSRERGIVERKRLRPVFHPEKKKDR